MTGKLTVAIALVVSGLIVLALPSGSGAASGEVQDVRVTNFPELQQVKGAVAIEGVVRHASLQTLKQILVPPVQPTQTTRLVDAGVIEGDGFTAIVLSLDGSAKGRILRPGTVGAILIPEEESIARIFQEEGLAHFPLEVNVALVPDAPRSFASEPAPFVLAFPRYRVRLYNTAETTVSVNLFAYLTN